MHLPGGEILTFHRGPDYLYVGDMRRWASRKSSTFATTVTSNMEKYTKAELKRAQEAQAFIKNAGYPSERVAIEMVSSGNISKLPFTTADIRRCFEIHGPSPAYVRGRKVKKAVSRTEVDPYLRGGLNVPQTMHADVMTWKGQNFLYGLAEPLGLNLCTPVRALTSEALGFALQEQVGTLRSKGFAPRVVYLDPQSGFTALVGQI